MFYSLVNNSLVPADGWAKEWQRFYKEVFNLEVNLDDVEIPLERPGFGWVVLVMQGLTLNQTWGKCRERFPSRSYLGNELDAEVPINERTSTVTYAERFRSCVEADKENMFLSVCDLVERQLQGITLLERLLLELWYYFRSGGHLDVDAYTFCAGSRHSSGEAPRVNCHDGTLCIDCYNLYDIGARIRARTAL